MALIKKLCSYCFKEELNINSTDDLNQVRFGPVSSVARILFLLSCFGFLIVIFYVVISMLYHNLKMISGM